jgi:hypothetical protein
MKNGNQKLPADLPVDWWRRLSTCQVLADWFSKHLLGLFLSYKESSEEQPRHAIATGFLLYHRETLLWVTAGHVVNKIRGILSNPGNDVLRMRWLDGCEIPGAESVMVHNRDLMMFSASEQGMDFGVVALTGLDQANIIKGGRVLVMTEQVWKNLHLAQPEGYYIVGYPQEWLEIEQERLDDRLVRGSATVNLACVPVERIELPTDAQPASFWNDPEAFYGRILPFADDPTGQPGSIVGMSGGPVFSIERDPDGKLRYRLFGIQSKCLEKSRRVRAEPIHKIVAMINE